MSLLETGKGGAKGRSNASILRKQYALIVPHSSKIIDFQRLLNAGYSVETIRVVMAAIAKLPEDRRPGSTALQKRFPLWVKRACETLQGYQISEKAVLLANEIADKAEPIPPEYVQNTIDVYSGFLTKLSLGGEFERTVWTMLPAPDAFTIHWYTRVCGKFSDGYRKFKLDHPMFLDWGRRLLKGVVADARVRWEELVRENGK